jgi:CheY-like chemotaxis protein
MLDATPAPSNPSTRPARAVRRLTAAVLAVTADAETRDLLLELAVADGFGLRCAATPAEAAAFLELEPPGLVVVDLDLPRPGGAAFLRGFRQGPHRDIPCMGITSTNDPMLAVRMDAPIFFKPDLDGIEAAVSRLFWPDRSPTR